MSETPNTTCPAEISNFCAQRHWSIYWILIVCSVAAMAVRVANVGDTDTDVLAAQQAKISMAAVTWGYQARAVLEKYHPTWLLNDPAQLLDLV